MSDVVMVAVLGAALLHAIWNALVKGGRDKGASLVAVVLGHVLPAAAVLPLVPAPAPANWPWLIAGAGLHAGYQGFLLLAYRTEDLSRVYPIARGSAPLIVALVSVGFLGVTLGGVERLAILVIAAGIAGVCLVGGANGAPDRRGTGFALVAGGFIAAYSLVDGTGARLAGSALGFYGWLTLVNALIVIGSVRAVRPGLLGRVARTGKRVVLVRGTRVHLPDRRRGGAVLLRGRRLPGATRTREPARKAQRRVRQRWLLSRGQPADGLDAMTRGQEPPAVRRRMALGT